MGQRGNLRALVGIWEFHALFLMVKIYPLTSFINLYFLFILFYFFFMYIEKKVLGFVLFVCFFFVSM